MTIMSGLIDGIPDAVALRCLARIPYSLYPNLELVSRSWKAAIRSDELFRARQEVGSYEDLLCVCSYEPDRTWQLYDPIQDLWITLPALPSQRRHFACFGVVSASQKLFVLGGRSDIDPLIDDRDGNYPTNEVWSYDPVTRNWSLRASMLVPRAMFACCLLDGKIVVAGGFTIGGKTTYMAEMYDPERDLWVPLPDLLHSPTASTGVVIGGKMHVIHRGLSTVQIFDHLELKWKVESCGHWLPGPMAVVQDTLYVMFKELIYKQNGGVRQVVLAPQFRRRFGMAMIGFKDKIYAFGGVQRLERSDLDFIKLSDVHVLTLEGENPTWSTAAPMTLCRGTVLGCTQLRI